MKRFDEAIRKILNEGPQPSNLKSTFGDKLLMFRPDGNEEFNDEELAVLKNTSWQEFLDYLIGLNKLPVKKVSPSAYVQTASKKYQGPGLALLDENSDLPYKINYKLTEKPGIATLEYRWDIDPADKKNANWLKLNNKLIGKFKCSVVDYVKGIYGYSEKYSDKMDNMDWDIESIEDVSLDFLDTYKPEIPYK